MTLNDFHIEFKIALDKLDSSAYPDILTEEIDYFLNEAQERFIKTRYGINNLYKEGFEEIQKRTDDLRTLVVTNFVPVSTVATETNTYSANILTPYTNGNLTIVSTEEYQFYLRSRVRVTKTGCINTSSIKLVRQGELERILLDPFNSPKFNTPIGYFERGILYIVTDGTFTINRLKLTYIKRAAKIRYGTIYPTPTTDINCELPEHTHKEIVQLAVNIALETIESRRQQTQEIQLNKIE